MCTNIGNYQKFFLFCLIIIYLNEWVLSMVRSTRLDFDKAYAVGYLSYDRIKNMRNKLYILNIKKK